MNTILRREREGGVEGEASLAVRKVTSSCARADFPLEGKPLKVIIAILAGAVGGKRRARERELGWRGSEERVKKSCRAVFRLERKRISREKERGEGTPALGY
jgi:hypothetical protein